MRNLFKTRAARWARDILLVVAVVLAIQWWQSRSLTHGPAPTLAGASLSGQPLALAQFRGQPVLVHFWATWCPVCRLEEKNIDRIAKDRPVLTVATTSGEAAELRDYMKKQGLSFSVMVDQSGDLARRWGVYGVPATFVVDSQGQIVHASRGYSTELGLRVRLALAD